VVVVVVVVVGLCLLYKQGVVVLWCCCCSLFHLTSCLRCCVSPVPLLATFLVQSPLTPKVQATHDTVSCSWHTQGRRVRKDVLRCFASNDSNAGVALLRVACHSTSNNNTCFFCVRLTVPVSIKLRSEEVSNFRLIILCSGCVLSRQNNTHTTKHKHNSVVRFPVTLTLFHCAEHVAQGSSQWRGPQCAIR
jgi:hypothetical protein